MRGEQANVYLPEGRRIRFFAEVFKITGIVFVRWSLRKINLRDELFREQRTYKVVQI